jgi:hypothetical protein
VNHTTIVPVSTTTAIIAVDVDGQVDRLPTDCSIPRVIWDAPMAGGGMNGFSAEARGSNPTPTATKPSHYRTPLHALHS